MESRIINTGAVKAALEAIKAAYPADQLAVEGAAYHYSIDGAEINTNTDLERYETDPEYKQAIDAANAYIGLFENAFFDIYDPVLDALANYAEGRLEGWSDAEALAAEYDIRKGLHTAISRIEKYDTPARKLVFKFEDQIRPLFEAITNKDIFDFLD